MSHLLVNIHSTEYAFTCALICKMFKSIALVFLQNLHRICRKKSFNVSVHKNVGHIMGSYHVESNFPWSVKIFKKESLMDFENIM